MNDELDWQLLDRFLAGDASAAEEERVRAWMSSSAEQRALVESLQGRLGVNAKSVDVERAWQRVAERTVRTRRVSSSRGIAWLAAAAVVLAVGSVVTMKMLGPPAPSTQVVAALHEVSAPLGQRASVTLPDSSTVVLNAGSTLRYDATFGQTERDVQLTGEAYFVVRHDATRPFRVRANNAAIQDVGTRFVVRAYDASHGTIVVVSEGAVGVTAADGAPRDTVVVMAGVLARMTTTGAITTTAVDAARYTGFSRGLLVLGDLTLDEAVPVIERWYNVTIHVTDSTLRRRGLNADFRDEPLPSVLDALGLALDVDVARNGRVVTISPRGPR